MTSGPVLFEDVSKTYGVFNRTYVVSGLTMEADKGDFMGLIGPNGSGKTTSLKMLANVTFPTSGCISIGGVDVRGDPETALEGVGSQIGVPGFLDDDTPRLLMDYCGLMKGMMRESASSEGFAMLQRLGMEEWADVRIKKFSRGMRQRIALGLALLGDPWLLILDEPTSGLDEESHRLILDLLQEVHHRGVTVIMASHDLRDVDSVCDTVSAIRNGKVASKRSIEDIRRIEGAVGMKVLCSEPPSADSIGMLESEPFVENISSVGSELTVTVLGGDAGIVRLPGALVTAGVKAFELKRVKSLEEIYLDFMKEGIEE